MNNNNNKYIQRIIISLRNNRFVMNIFRKIYKIILWMNNKSVLQVQAYGKLPFYDDYLEHSTTTNSKKDSNWMSWMLKSFKQNTFENKDNWPFLFQENLESNIVIGIIGGSSDGSRKFPFSLYVNFSKKHFSWNNCFFIWNKLEFIRSEMNQINNITQLKMFLKKQYFHVTIENNNLFNVFFDKQYFFRPMFIIVNKSNSFKYLIADDSTNYSEFFGIINNL